MKQNFYIFSDTVIRKKDKTLMFETIQRNSTNNEDYLISEIDHKDYKIDGKKHIPIESIDSIFSFGDIRFNTRLLNLLSRNEIPLHIFSFNGKYSGTFYPFSERISGDIILKQSEHFSSHNKRLNIARAFVDGAARNLVVNLNYYRTREYDLNEEIDYIKEIESRLHRTVTINELMGLEGSMRKVYYSAWDKIFNCETGFYRRVKNPPDNIINALISYGNMIVYAVCLNEIFRTRLTPQISYLHQPGDNRLSLSFDIAEIFKPLIVDRTIFKVINKKLINPKSCVMKDKMCLLSKRAKSTYIQEIDLKLATVIKQRNSERNLSYRRIIREECYKLIEHIKGKKEYKPFVMKW